jgi:hypothetical protein
MLDGKHPQQTASPTNNFQLCEGMQQALTPATWLPGVVINHPHFEGPHSAEDADLISRALTWHQVRWSWFGRVETCTDCAAGKFRDDGGHWHGCELCISAMMANACVVCVHLLAVGQPQLRCTVLTSYAEFAAKMGWQQQGG